MSYSWISRTNLLLALIISLAFVVACGSSATSTPTSAGDPIATKAVAPTALPTPTSAPAQSAKPSGTLSMGQSDMGRFTAHPKLVGNPGIFLHGNAPIGEALFALDSKKELTNILVSDWGISADFTTWTFNLRKGVQFHKGYGEMTSEDVVWSYNEWSKNEKHPRGSIINGFWNNPEGNVQTPDDYTVIVDTGAPQVQAPIMAFLSFPFGGTTWVSSKKQFDEMGDDEVDSNIAATGPWEITETETGQFWKMRAVEDHYRQTPDFAELIFWEIPEESARVAGFQTGNLDTFVMAFDSIATVEDVPGAKFVTVPQAGAMALNFYGNFYMGIGTEDQRPAYNPDLAWVSSNPDVDSPEWESARKVREAMSMAIDRDTIIDTLMLGFAGREVMPSFTGNDGILEPGFEWPYDPVRAKELLVEAGYPDGFTATITTAKRGAPAEDSVCEAVASMLEAIGIDANLQNLPYSTLRPTIVGRTYEGLTCHGLPIRDEPVVGMVIHLSTTAFTHGWEHEWLEENINIANNSLDPADLKAAQKKTGEWMIEQVVQPALFSWNAVWPVGPNIEPWGDHVWRTDPRAINGFEFIKHRK